MEAGEKNKVPDEAKSGRTHFRLPHLPKSQVRIFGSEQMVELIRDWASFLHSFLKNLKFI